MDDTAAELEKNKNDPTQIQQVAIQSTGFNTTYFPVSTIIQARAQPPSFGPKPLTDFNKDYQGWVWKQGSETYDVFIAESTSGDGTIARASLQDADSQYPSFTVQLPSGRRYGFARVHKSGGGWEIHPDYQVGLEAAPLWASLSGPGSIDSGQEGTWTASVSGGQGSISYDWEYKSPGSSTWSSAWSCSGSSCSRDFYNSKSYTRTAEMRVTVTRGTETEQATTSTGIIGSDDGDDGGGGGGTLMDDPGTLVIVDQSGRRPVGIEGPSSQNADGRTAKLRWSTTGPLPPSTFVVEHRTDSTAAWSRLGTVAARDSAQSDGAGGPAYRFRTDRLEVGTHQFRLTFEPSGQAKAQDWTSEPTTARIELERPYQLSTYPNPARQQATVELAVKERQPVTIRLYDVLGRQVETLHRGPVPAHTARRLPVDVSEMELSSGTYFLRARGETFTATTRLTVAR